ncbi:arginine deiminase-related protein [Neolewinella lacunae]|uniref:Amidinotransferase n=1 Tax=Neolewinella lacunae TaxID=1517758 RepID=A0A923PIZ4_9BACT|nr:arginine deiminase-related protein [Neolewinella lacunae]MBC6993561.1 amidinotransferase [Neolewinella lacunae]MDN3636163.1 arginine deiminase-related protein [Neolewinella lacunae]
MPNQTTHHLLMIRPRNFAIGSNSHADNAFQAIPKPGDQEAIVAAAIEEFDHYVATLRQAGLTITVVEDLPSPVLPDSVFPNNWFTTHDDGLVVTYPMHYPKRRLERRQDVLDLLDADHFIDRSLSLEHWEDSGLILEGTGSLVLDRANRIAYCSFSDRAHPQALHDWCDAMHYRPLSFHAYDRHGQAIYHTNVILAVGNTAALLGIDCITDPAEQAKVVESLAMTGKEIIPLSHEQIEHFCGNALEVATPAGPAWVMSSQAFHALEPEQVAALGAPIVHAPLDVIEKYGGGSARCMIAEIFLQPK